MAIDKSSNEEIFFIRERKDGADCFAVPGEDYGAGYITGTKAARDFMRALALGVEESWSLRSLIGGGRSHDPMNVIKAAAAVVASDRWDDPRRGAAVGFLRGLEIMLGFAAKHCQHQEYFERSIARQVESLARDQMREAQQKIEFVQRMKAAKRMKVEKRALAEH